MAASLRSFIFKNLPSTRVLSACLSTSVRCHSLTDQFRQAQEKKAQEVRLRPVFRTNISEPSKHTLHQEGMFYTVPKEEMDKYLQQSLSVPFARMTKTFNECTIMVRRPAIEIIHYLKQMNYNLPAVRFVVYGDRGNGRSLTLSHVLHYCAQEDWLLVHCPWPRYWCNRYREILMSSYKPGRVDQPIEAIDWLKWFRLQNGDFIKKNDLRTSQTYTWSKREQTDAGSSLDAVVEQGIMRAKYAADCVGVLLKEIKLQGNEKKFKTLVMVDGVNALWSDTKIKDENKVRVPVDQLSLVNHFKKMLKNDWTNAAIVVSVDQNASPLRGESCLPRYLLGKEGFEFLDPFVPVHVPLYSEKEIYSCIEYYADRLWIQNPKARTDEGKKELVFLSEHNPLALFDVTSAW